MGEKEYTTETTGGPQNLKYILSGPWEKKFLAPGVEYGYNYNTHQLIKWCHLTTKNKF